MSWNESLSCGHYGGIRANTHACVCADTPEHDGDHSCTCREHWENRAHA